jgi:hypothetical protein
VEARTGIKANRLYKLESGIGNLSIPEMHALCSVYGLPYSAVMSGYEEETGVPEKAGAGASAPEDAGAVMQARQHLQQAATLLGLKVVPESDGSDPEPDRAVKYPANDAPAVAVVRELAEASGQADDVPVKLLKRAEKELRREQVAALIDAAEQRGLDVDEYQDVLEPDVSPDREALVAGTLRDLLIVHAVYGVDPRGLTLDEAKRLNAALAEVLPVRAQENSLVGDGVVEEPNFGDALVGRSEAEALQRMIREMLPFMREAAKTDSPPVEAIRGGASDSDNKSRRTKRR